MTRARNAHGGLRALVEDGRGFAGLDGRGRGLSGLDALAALAREARAEARRARRAAPDSTAVELAACIAEVCGFNARAWIRAARRSAGERSQGFARRASIATRAARSHARAARTRAEDR